MNATPLLGTILDGLAAEKIEAVLIGNAAAAVQGAPVTTLDFDFMFRDTPANLAKLKRLAKRLDAVIFTPLLPSSGQPRFYRLMSDVSGLRIDFLPVARGWEARMAARRRKTAETVERRRVSASARDDRAREALARESDAQLDDLIRRRLALPVEARMNFLRRRLPGGGSSL